MSDNKSIPISPAALEAFAQVVNVPASNDDAPDPAKEELSDTGRAGLSSERAAALEGDDASTENADPRYPITVLSGFCTRLAGSACERCTLVCPYDAITLGTGEPPQLDQSDPSQLAQDAGPHIDADFCTRCGLCCGICDAFVTERITMNDLLDKVRRLAADGDPVFFTCYDQIPEGFEVHPNVIVLPCIGAVAPEFWASALEIEQIQIYCNFALCTDCPTAGDAARNFFTHAVNLGEQWTQIHMGKAERLPEKTDILSRFFEATSDEYHRRGIATSLADEVVDITSGKHRKRYSDTLANFHANKEHLRAQGHARNAKHHQHTPASITAPAPKQWPRLQMLSSTVQDHPAIAPNIPRYLAAVDSTVCQHCYESCFAHCPAGARALAHNGSIKVDPLLCIACGNCALYCPHGAAYLYETDASIFLSENEQDQTF